MNEYEFDKQIQDSFGGIGKQRTVLSGEWKAGDTDEQ